MESQNQIQAGFVLDSVYKELHLYGDINKKTSHVNGLFKYLSTFNVATNLNITTHQDAPNILAVVSNLISRGIPTLASIRLEEKLVDCLGLTNKNNQNENGVLSYSLKSEVIGEKLFNALHVIEPRAINRDIYLNQSLLDSNFEKVFLFDYISEEKSYLCQLFEHQRVRSSITRDGNAGYVDFSLEIPYYGLSKKFNRFRQTVLLKNQKTFIVEVDGAAYHDQLIDDLKDFEISNFSNTITHISENNAHEDHTLFLNTILKEDFLNCIEQNFQDKSYHTNSITSLVLVPFAVARIQKTLIQYLISNYKGIEAKESLNIAVIERDIPCAQLAIDDLNFLIETLNDLTIHPIYFPKINLHVYGSEDFKYSKLHLGHAVKIINDIDFNDFDVVFDISMLRRENIFKEDIVQHENLIQIRNCHYVHYLTKSEIISSFPVKYKPLVDIFPNEVYEPKNEIVEKLKILLQNIFRKTDFRPGQLPILNRAMQLESVIGLLPTGGGKSLTYQLAAMLQPGITIVVDPIRSLMVDQYNGLKEIGIDKCEFINSTLSNAEKRFNQNELLPSGQIQFLFISPERFVIDEFRKALDNTLKNGHAFSYVVIDEVHCVSEWGHDFRTPYLNLGDNAQEFCLTYGGKKNIPLFGLTATASFDVLADIERELNIKQNDGNAVVRYENSVRDEINYVIKDTTMVVDGIENLNERRLKELIGRNKQTQIFNLIEKKEKLFSKFNNREVILNLIDHSYNNYIATTFKQKWLQKFNNNDLALQAYREHLFKKLSIDNPFLINEDNYNYGIIVFFPHKKGWLGIRNSSNSHGLYDNPNYVLNDTTIEDKTVVKFIHEKLGYFMGSGDDETAAIIDEESFYHLQEFKKNRESVMIATKAFGMGIDKPNVRMTIHINIPQSIESFVQEAGRAGRDGKMSLSYVLFNNNQIEKLGKNNIPYLLDRDVLMYFHKNSFKGELKERVMIYELRNQISFPNTTKLNALNTELNDFFGNDSLEFSINLGNGNHINRIFVNTIDRISVGFVNLDSQITGIYNDLGNNLLCEEIVSWLKSKLPFHQNLTVDQLRNWLNQQVVNTNKEIGIEKLISEMKIGETKELPIPFTNKYYSKKTKTIDEYVLNPFLKELIFKSKPVKELIEKGILNEDIFSNVLRYAFYNELEYSEFVENMCPNYEEIRNKLLDVESEWSIELQKVYYIRRNQEDTAKAIYRLVSVGIINSYTIDYQNKLYTVYFTKKKDEDYYQLLEELVARYTSKKVAKLEIKNLEKEKNNLLKENKATVISVCLEYLTKFIYSRIKAKRLQAIDDMVKLCQNSILIENQEEQNKFIKDEIYYYFNAKYSRRGNIEKTRKKDIPASMPDDYGILFFDKFIDKYIKLVENEETGEFISNVKHLRGSSMKMLRQYPERPEFRILKSYTLFILADSINGLLTEAKDEIIQSLIDWKNLEADFNPIEFSKLFVNRIKKHITTYNIEKEFDDIEDVYYSKYYASWTSKFANQFLA